MAVPEQTPFVEYIANGITTVFPTPFQCDKSEYLIVMLNDEDAPVGSWSYTNNEVTFNTAPNSNVKVTIERNTPLQRTSEYNSYNNAFRPSPVNKDFDLIWWKLQELGFRDQVIWLALVKEISDRVNGDINLQNQINIIDTWLENLQQQVDWNTDDIAQLVSDLSKEIADRIANDEALKEMFLAMMDEAINEGTINALAVTHVNSLEALEAIANVWDGRTVYVKDLGNYKYDALTTSWVKSYQDAENVQDGSLNQKQINSFQSDFNDKALTKVGSISELIQVISRKDGQVIEVLSYHAGKNTGGDKFEWLANSSKSLHDGGHYIDPSIPIPSLSNFKNYYTAVNSTNGIWARKSRKTYIATQDFGMIDDNSMVWNCAAIMASLKKAMKLENGLSTPRKVIIPSGLFFTSDVIELALFQINQRVPPLIGQGRFNTELRKVTSNVISEIYPVSNIDAVIFVHPTTAMGAKQIFGEHTAGMQLSRTPALNRTGYGYYAHGSPESIRNDIICNGHWRSYWQDDCWMSQASKIYGITCVYGPAIRGGTSVNGANIYADRCDRIGIDLYGLTYSSLTVHADGCGTDPASTTGYPAISLQFLKGSNLTASTERHRGTDFYIQYCDGGAINSGRSVNATAVSAPTAKVFIQDSTIQFNAYSWRYALENLTAEQKALYTFIQEVGINSAWSFNECQGNDQWPDFPAQASDSSYVGRYAKSRYSEDNGTVRAIVLHNSGSWKKLLYLGNATMFRVLTCICGESDRYYDFGAAPIRKVNISTNPSLPTTLTAQQYTNGVADNAQPLQVYLGADNWVYMMPSAGGANLSFRYFISK